MDSQRYDTSYDSLEKRIDVGKQQLLSIFKFFQINPADHHWADIWAGSGIWSLILQEITKKAVLYVDLDPAEEKEPNLIENSFIQLKFLDTRIERIPEEINAVFLRSCASVESIVDTIKTQHNINLFLFIPDGLNEDKIELWMRAKTRFEAYYENVRIETVNSPISLRGPRSKRVVQQNQEIPVILMYNRKNRS